MDFTISPELVEFRSIVRKFVENELIPWETYVEEHDGLPEDVEKELRAKAVQIGLNGMGMPAEVGGQEFSTLDQVFISEEDLPCPRRSVVQHDSRRF